MMSINRIEIQIRIDDMISAQKVGKSYWATTSFRPEQGVCDLVALNMVLDANSLNRKIPKDPFSTRKEIYICII